MADRMNTCTTLLAAIGTPGERTIVQRLDGAAGRLEGIGERLDSMERVLHALALAQGIDPDALD